MLTPLIAWLAPLSLICTFALEYGIGDKGNFLFNLGAIPFLLAAPVAFSGGFHATKPSVLSFVLVLISGFVVMGSFLMLGMFILAFGGPIIFGVFALQALMAVLTCVLAANNRNIPGS